MKIVLAYSGGLDTSVIVKWLRETYDAEIVTFAADIGQEEELKGLPQKARKTGASKHYTLDLVEEFARDYIYPMIRANAIYEGQYYLGTSIARPLIAKAQVEIAKQEKADTVAHGATGKGNDQCRFELTYMALNPRLQIIAPWKIDQFREAFPGRAEMIAYCQQHKIPVEAPEYVHMRTISPEAAPDKATIIKIGFEKGDAVSINGVRMSPATILAQLNDYGRDNGIGRIDLVENRFVGMKSRGVYETPGGTILWQAHRAIESVTLDRGAMHLKDDLMPRYAALIYNGFWFSPEREMLQALIDKSQEHVEGEVTLDLYKGNVMVAGRASPKSLYSSTLVTFEDDKGAYDQKDAEGFIRLNALRLRTLAMRGKNT